MITRTTLRGYVTAYGTIEAEPAGERPAASARVAPSLPGVVTAVQCVEGQHVAKGALLFQLDSRVRRCGRGESPQRGSPRKMSNASRS